MLEFNDDECDQQGYLVKALCQMVAEFEKHF